MEKSDNVESLEVGKYYLVPCALIINKVTETELGFIPVIGSKHNDKQFGVSEDHYHIDGRFFNKGSGFFVDENGMTNSIINANKNPYCYSYIKEIVYKKRKCIRLTTGIKPPEHAVLYWKWYEDQLGKSCKGKKCPHLGHKMEEKEGRLVCPLHGLVGDLKTEKIIKIVDSPEFY